MTWIKTRPACVAEGRHSRAGAGRAGRSCRASEVAAIAAGENSALPASALRVPALAPRDPARVDRDYQLAPFDGVVARVR